MSTNVSVNQADDQRGIMLRKYSPDRAPIFIRCLSSVHVRLDDLDHPDTHPIRCFSLLHGIFLNQHGHARADWRRSDCLLQVGQGEPGERQRLPVENIDGIRALRRGLFRPAARVATADREVGDLRGDLAQGHCATRHTLRVRRYCRVAGPDAQFLRGRYNLWRGPARRCHRLPCSRWLC